MSSRWPDKVGREQVRIFHFPSLLMMHHQKGGRGVLDALERGGHLMHLDSNHRLDTGHQVKKHQEAS